MWRYTGKRQTGTFTGIIMAMRDYQDKLKEHGARFYVRRGGPNFQEGLRLIKEAADELGLPIVVTGPETHMTEVVPMALNE